MIENDIPAEVTVTKEGHRLNHRMSIHLLIRDKYIDEVIDHWERSPVLMGVFLDFDEAIKMLVDSEFTPEYHTMRVVSIRLTEEDRFYLEDNLGKLNGLLPSWQFLRDVL